MGFDQAPRQIPCGFTGDEEGRPEESQGDCGPWLHELWQDLGVPVTILFAPVDIDITDFEFALWIGGDHDEIVIHQVFHRDIGAQARLMQHCDVQKPF